MSADLPKIKDYLDDYDAFEVPPIYRECQFLTEKDPKKRELFNRLKKRMSSEKAELMLEKIIQETEN